MRDFSLQEYRVAVDVMGITYYVTDTQYNVHQDANKAFPFHKLGAIRVAKQEFPDCPTQVQLIGNAEL